MFIPAQGLTRHFLGDLKGARGHFQHAVENYREEDWPSASLDLGVASHIFAGTNEWQLGHPDRAASSVEKAISLAHRQNNSIALAASAAIGAAGVYSRRGDFGRAVQASDEALRLSTMLGLQQYGAVGKIYGGCARAKLGETNGAVQRVREGLTELNPQGSHVASARYLALLCETQKLAGEVDDALLTVEEALQTNSEVLIYRPELLRLRAELNLQKISGSDTRLESAERDCREAIELASRMHSRSIELQATTSLARMLRDTGRREEARTMLAEIYNWFTEGFDTADLIDAKALLDQLQ
jgi:tetratricopeptide (TPR) repeat protein